MQLPYIIVYQDNYVFVLNKTAKILVVPSPKKEKNTLTSVLSRQLNRRMYPCHRLDRETSGLIIYATSESIQQKIMDQFRCGQVRKKYQALVKGNLANQRGVFSDMILDREGRRFGEQPKPAKAFFTVLRRTPDFNLLELEPATGRTNQLRIQLAKRNHPILGEDKYAMRRDFKVNFKRLALHACFLHFRHPVTSKSMEFSLDLPADMSEFLNSF